jgi:Ca2+-binding EF-hand superfamily protein
MGLVIVPRDYVEGGGGLWNSTKAVTSGLLFVQDGGERSLFYDGYSKQPINWMGIPLRLDLLYFVAIVGTPAVSLVAVLRSMGEKLNNVAQGNASLTVNLDPNAHGAATILGRYTFGRTLKQNEESMRQRLRKQLDQWLQSHAEERQMEEINTNWCLRIVYDTRLLVGFLATVALIIVYIMLLYWILTSDVTITLPMGGAIKLAFISELLITILDEVMAPVIGLIVKAEGHIRHNDELGQLLKRTFVTKIVQVIVILYESFSSAETTCPEAEYGAVFARLVLADTLITITLNYFDLYSVNHGIPLPNYYSTVRSFQHENNKKRMSMLGSRWFGCCSKKHTYENHIPGEVQGTDWEILWKPESTQSATKAGSDTAQSDAGSYVFVRTADYSDESKGEHERETTIMPPEVKEALSYTYRLQRRIVMPEPLSLEDRVRGETQEAARTTWWKRRKQRFGGNKDTQKAKRGQLTSDWATSVPMQRLTSGKIKRVSLGVCACMLIDAGYSTKKRMVASNLNPDELVDKMWKQRGHHRYKFKNPGQVKRARQQAAAERSKQGRTERPGAPRYGVRYEAFFELLIESESIDAMDAATEKEEPLSPKTSNGELEPEPEPEPETVPEPEPEPEPEAVKTNDETAKPYLVVLQDGILSYYRTRDPKKEFVDKMGDCEGISQEEYEEKFAKLCKRMARKQKLNAHRVLKEISKAKKKPRVEVWQFEAWWFENGAKLVAKQSVTGTMQTKQIHKVSKQEAPGQMPSIIVESSRRTLKLTRSGSGWFGRTRDEMAMESKGDGSLLNVWLELLDGARAPYTVPNWGKTLQDLSDGTGTDGGASKRNALRRKQLIRAAEEHVSAGHAFAEGPANTMLREIFDEFDVDGSGTLDKDEVRLLLQKLRALHQTADAEHRYHEARKKSEANPHNQELQNKAAEAQQEAQNVEDQKAKSLTSYEVEGYMKQMELEQSQDGKVEFNEFVSLL